MNDYEYMKRALGLAKKGAGTTSPNPMVGAVLVSDGIIIGEGYHRKRGEAHAEINALNSVCGSAYGATLYVNLEPCSHYGRTPPCANALIEAGIKRAVIAMADPNPEVAGKGICMMKEAGIQVEVGLLEKDAHILNEVFIKYVTTPYPFVIQKSAVTLDGKTACVSRDAKWITGEEARQYTHEIRNRMTGIMVGVETVLEDDPELTTRLDEGKGKDPHRIIVDSRGRIPLKSRVITTTSNAKTILATTNNISTQKEKALVDRGVEIIKTRDVSGRVDLEELMRVLHQREMDGILLEGGGTLNYSMHIMGLVDKVVYFIAPKIFGGRHAPTSVDGDGIRDISQAIILDRMTCRSIGDDMVIEGYVRKG